MLKACSLPLVAAVFSSLLTGCSTYSMLGTSGSPPPANTVPVSLTMTDDPPAGVNVLFFQVSLTAASLMPPSGPGVSLLNNNTPIQIDVTQLQALSAFLSTANVPAGPYNSLSLTFASPQLVIFNAADQSIASTCAVGSVCQLTPTVDNSATVSLTSAPFPVTVAPNSPLGFLVDFHLNTIIQSDLSVNLQAANGVTVSQLPPSPPPSQPPPFGSLTGTVESVTASSNQFTLMTAWGRTFTIDTNSSTTYNDFPPLTCTSTSCGCNPGSFMCIAAGQIVQVQIAALEGAGTLLASQVTYLQAAGQQTVEGTIVAIPPLPLPSGETVIELILHRNPNANNNLPVGGMAQVAIWAPGTGGETAATFSIDANGFTIPSGYTFTSSSDLAVGQTVQVTVASGSLTAPTDPDNKGGWGPPVQLSFTASNLELEPSQITGTIASISSPSFTLNDTWSPCALPGGGAICNVVGLIQYGVVTTSQTGYQGFTTDDFSSLAVNDVVSVNGWLFPQNGSPTSATGPSVVAQNVVLHENGWF